MVDENKDKDFIAQKKANIKKWYIEIVAAVKLGDFQTSARLRQKIADSK